MHISDEEYKLLVEMVQEDVRRQMNWLQTKVDPQYKLYNAGQKKAFQYVLDLLAVNDD